MGNLAKVTEMMKRWVKGAVVAVAVFLALLAGAGFYMLDYALKPDALVTRSRDVAGAYAGLLSEYPELQGWLDSLQSAGALRERYLQSGRGDRLHAIYVRAARPTRRTAVIVHGYTDNAVRMLPIGYMYGRQLGCNILLPDLHAHGLSEGDAIQMGWLDRQDVSQWIGEAANLFGDSIEVVVHGVSMGAATTMMLGGDPLPSSVKCLVEDCGYTSVWDEFGSELEKQFGLPAFPLLHVASMLCGMKYGWNFREASALEQVKRCRLPMFFIHGDADRFVPTWMVHPLYEAKSGEKELWIVPGAAHAVSYKENKREYTRRVGAFVGKYFMPVRVGGER